MFDKGRILHRRNTANVFGTCLHILRHEDFLMLTSVYQHPILAIGACLPAGAASSRAKQGGKGKGQPAWGPANPTLHASLAQQGPSLHLGPLQPFEAHLRASTCPPPGEAVPEAEATPAPPLEQLPQQIPSATQYLSYARYQISALLERTFGADADNDHVPLPLSPPSPFPSSSPACPSPTLPSPASPYPARPVSAHPCPTRPLSSNPLPATLFLTLPFPARPVPMACSPPTSPILPTASRAYGSAANMGQYGPAPQWYGELPQQGLGGDRPDGLVSPSAWGQFAANELGIALSPSPPRYQHPGVPLPLPLPATPRSASIGSGSPLQQRGLPFQQGMPLQQGLWPAWDASPSPTPGMPYMQQPAAYSPPRGLQQSSCAASPTGLHSPTSPPSMNVGDCDPCSLADEPLPALAHGHGGLQSPTLEVGRQWGTLQAKGALSMQEESTGGLRDDSWEPGLRSPCNPPFAQPLSAGHQGFNGSHSPVDEAQQTHWLGDSKCPPVMRRRVRFNDSSV